MSISALPTSCRTHAAGADRQDRLRPLSFRSGRQVRPRRSRKSFTPAASSRRSRIIACPTARKSSCRSSRRRSATLREKSSASRCFFWDITAQHRAALALADSERRYRRLTEATLDGIIVIDRNERITPLQPGGGAHVRLPGRRSPRPAGADAGAGQAPHRRINAGFAGSSTPSQGLAWANAGIERPAQGRQRVPRRGRPQRAQSRRRDGARNSEQEPDRGPRAPCAI